MAYDDIQVRDYPNGGSRIMHFPMNASESFGKGDIVSVDNTGQLTESADDPVDADIMGVAMGGPGGPGTITLNNPVTDAAYATGAMIPVLIPDSNTYFMTKNFATDGAGTQAAPAVANIGDEAGLTLQNDTWTIDVGGSQNTCRIVDVLDSTKDTLNPRAGGTARTVAATDTFWVVFQIISHQSAPFGDAVDAPIA